MINRHSNFDEIGEITTSGCDIDGNLREGRTFTYPFYTCGHCCKTILINPSRSRERTRCTSCKRVLCEKNELCMVGCTPLHAMSHDKFENPGKYGRFVGAIMRGETKVEEAEKKGLLLTV